MNQAIAQSTIPTDRYWASVEREELPQVLLTKALAFRQRVERDGRLQIWRRSERMYYGLDGDGGWANSVAVTYGGDEGELVLARVNHYRSIVQAVIAMVTGTRPAFTASAINTDVKSLEQSTIAKGVIEWAYRDKRIEDFRVDQVERAVVSGEGYLHLRWDVHAGRVVPGADGQRPVYNERGEPEYDEIEETTIAVGEAPELGAAMADPNAPAPPGGMQAPPEAAVMVQSAERMPRMESYKRREGDVVPEVLGPLSVVRDLDAREAAWALVPHRENVWNLVSRYPQLRDHLLALRGREQWARTVWASDAMPRPVGADSDDLTVWCFYHPPCDALPEGRYSLVTGDLVLADEEWRFDDEIPVYPLVPMTQMDTASGYSPMWDLLCLQELLDAVVTAVASAHDAVGIQNVIAPKGADVSPEMLSRGLQLIEWDVVEGAPDAGRPTPLQLLQIPQDSYKLMEIYQRTMETLSGVNSVTRGDPQANLKSGAALALVSSLSVHFNSSLQARVTRNDERVATGLLKLYQRFSPIPRLAEITGQRGKRKMLQFVADDLIGVQRIHVEMMNPALRQSSGLMEIAFELLKAGIIKNPDQFFELLDSGRIDPLFEDDRDEQRLIRSENEALANGRPVIVANTDRDDVHMRRHARVFDDPELRSNGAVLKAVFNHLEQHQKALNDKPIEMMWSIGQQIPPWRSPGQGGPPPPGGGPPGPEAPPPGGPPPGAGGPPGGSREPAAERAQVMGQMGPESGPLMPTNPLTGERAPNPTQA
jgi:hypothetical protein